MRKTALLAATAGVVAAGIVGARFAFPLPALDDRLNDRPTDAARTGPLAEKLVELAAQHPGKSGLHTLPQADAAFAARIILARTATATIDTQYYIWHDDLTGLLLLDELKAAADRGVRVRLLLDDNGIENLDAILVALDDHPNFQVRLYNPFTVRGFKPAGYAFDFFRLNRRMHNKSFTVDGLATIGGGRNVGDEYFGTGDQPNYVDLDLLATGAIVQEISDDFAKYWNSQSAFPIGLLVVGDAKGVGITELNERLASVSQGPQLTNYRQKVEQDEVVSQLANGTLPLEWTTATLVSDPPDKTLDKADDEQILIGQLDDLMGRIDDRLDIVSPYFVPGEKATNHFVALARRGVRVRILTNSMDATDVLPVHAGYAKYRSRLLEGGVELFELKADKTTQTDRADAGLIGSSSASLHAKCFAVDAERIYIGSFNFDPRSARLNTEMGLLVDSETMARTMHVRFDKEITSMAYAVSLNDEGDIVWTDTAMDGTRSTYNSDPNSTLASRAAVKAIGWLPIQWLL